VCHGFRILASGSNPNKESGTKAVEAQKGTAEEVPFVLNEINKETSLRGDRMNLLNHLRFTRFHQMNNPRKPGTSSRRDGRHSLDSMM
jgi:hypothetical protein